MRPSLPKLAFETRVQRRQVALDAVVVFGIAAALLFLYNRVPLALQHRLALDHTDPTVHALWTHAYVHEPRPDDSHLLGNLVTYFLVVVPAWLLCLVQDQRERFYVALGAFLFVVPPIIAGVNFLAMDGLLDFSPKFDRGFSGVVAAIAGFLLILALEYVENHMDRRDGSLVMVLTLVFLFGGLAFVQTGLNQVIALVVAGTAFAVYVGGGLTGTLSTPDRLWAWGAERPLIAVLVFGGLLASVYVFVAALPGEWITEDGVVNIVGHGAGLVLGMVIALLSEYLA